MTRGRFSAPQQAPMFYGVVFDREDDDTFGVILRVRAGEREYDCRPCFVGAVGLQGRYDPVPDGAQVLVVLPNGSAQSALAIVGIPSEASPVPSDYDGSKTVSYGLVEHRADAGATVEGVLLRPLLDDLATLTRAVQDLLTAITGTVIVPQDGGAAIKAAVSLAATASITANLATVLTNINTSKAGSGTAPHCSGVWRAQAGS